MVGSNLSGIQCFAVGYCFAIGQSLSKVWDGNDVQTLVEEWNGSTWSVIPSPSVPGTLTDGLLALSCIRQTSCLAVGRASLLNSNTEFTVAERWNGASWTMVTSASPTKGNNTLDALSCATPSACFAVRDTNADPFNSFGYVSMIEQWNGLSWQLIASPNAGATNDMLQGVSCPGPSLCFAVGGYQPRLNESTSVTLIEKWNGTARVGRSFRRPTATDNRISADFPPDLVFTDGSHGLTRPADTSRGPLLRVSTRIDVASN